MLNANLLPETEKRGIRLEKARRVVAFFAAAAVSVFTLAAVFILPVWLPLFLERRELERSFSLEKEASRKLNTEETVEELRSLRSVLFSLNSHFAAPPRASWLLEKFLRSAPSGLALKNVGIKANGEVLFGGEAKNRRNLLEWEKILRDSGMLQEISYPLSSIIREENAVFSVQGKLKTGYGLQ